MTSHDEKGAVRMKKIILIIIFCVSIGLNLYLIGSNYLKSTYTPTAKDLELLGEMTQMVLEADQFKEIASKEQIFAIQPGVSRFNVANPPSIYHYEIYVKTNQETYIFNCTDKNCSNMSNEGGMYSRYSEMDPILPLENHEK